MTAVFTELEVQAIKVGQILLKDHFDKIGFAKPVTGEPLADKSIEILVQDGWAIKSIADNSGLIRVQLAKSLCESYLIVANRTYNGNSSTVHEVEINGFWYAPIFIDNQLGLGISESSAIHVLQP